MRRKRIIVMLAVFILTLVLAACGEKTPEDVLSKLEDRLSDMDGYKANAVMKMRTGNEDRDYEIEIWHKKEDYYRVALSTATDDETSQIILKNDDGVFVLTPSLNKSFKFQTEWPENSSQPYLFQSLVNDVKNDSEATLTVTDLHYIFETKTNYQSNNTLPFQEIYFDKKNYTPVLVKVLDNDKQPLVEVSFSSFELNPSFGDDDFKTEENMATNGEEDVSVSGSVTKGTFATLYPLETVGAQLTDKKEVELDNGLRVIMTFSGDRNFTLIQEMVESVPTMSFPKEVQGEIVNLGFTIGALSENMIEWNYNGVDYYLASEDLTKAELIDVATSVQGREVK